MRAVIRKTHQELKRVVYFGNMLSALYAVGGLVAGVIGFLIAQLAKQGVAFSLIVLLGCLVLGMSVSLAFLIHRQYRVAPLVANLRQTHMLAHFLRDYLQNRHCVCEKIEPEDPFKEVARILDHLQETMMNVTRRPCTASLMLREENSDSMKTIVWSCAADKERIALGATRLDGEGLAWQALQERDYMVLDDLQATEGWAQTHAKHAAKSRHYRSAIICPFKVNNVFSGVVHVDSPRVGSFSPYHAPIVALAADTIGSLLGVFEYTGVLDNTMGEDTIDGH